MDTSSRPSELFDLRDRVAVVTGGSGLLGRQHCSILASAGARVISLDIDKTSDIDTVITDITDERSVREAVEEIASRFGTIDILINNAARNPKVEDGVGAQWSRFESFDRDAWDLDIAVGLTGAFLVSQAIGPLMAKRHKGVIVNVCSDLAVISPDQRLYRQEGLAADEQPVKPVSYSIVKHGLLGLTRYLATYWADQGVRVNAISPGGIYSDQDDAFVTRLSQLIPLGRMADVDEYQGAILFMCSDASSYMTGHNLVIDGGRTCW